MQTRNTITTHGGTSRVKFLESWSCSVGYDLRIIFKFVEYEESQAILLETIGTHDGVY